MGYYYPGWKIDPANPQKSNFKFLKIISFACEIYYTSYCISYFNMT